MSDPKMIDLTPVGAQTPEGYARINEAVKELEEAKFACADLLNELLDTMIDGDGLLANLQAIGYDSDDAEEFAGELCGAVKRWCDAGEQFASAVAGAP